MRTTKAIVSVGTVLLLVSACSSGGGGGDSSSASAASSAPSAASAGASASASPAAGGQVTSYHDAQGAVVQIVADGEFQDPGAADATQGSWSGSGFIIDPTGLAVTNAHVAEGAATLKVYVGGSKTPVNAKLLGISECNDLAVIDLNGDGFPYLKWHEGPVDVTTQVWAAGFPLGDPQYTVVDGTVSKNNALGDTEWASLDYRLEHTAPIQHGNSGGPLIMEDGSVAGVNYAGGYGNSNTDQFYAIPAALAQPVVDVLKTGADQDGIGVNGQAFYDEKSALAGIWVSGVRSGSPASEAGVKAGDVITKMEGRDAVTSSDIENVANTQVVTKRGYCDVLKTQGDKPFKLQVYRTATGEVLEGEVNNPDRPLAAISALNNNTGSASDAPSSAPTGDVTYATVTDDTGAMSVELPDAWGEVDTSASSDGSGQIIASSNMKEFNDGSATGIFFSSFDADLAAKDLKKTMRTFEKDDGIASLISTCKESEAGTVQEGDGYSYIGNSYWSCQGSDLSYYLSIRTYPDTQKAVIVLSQFTTDQDVEFVNRSLASLIVN
jgi:serine protease Do